MLALEHRCAFEIAFCFALFSGFPVRDAKLIFEIS